MTNKTLQHLSIATAGLAMGFGLSVVEMQSAQGAVLTFDDITTTNSYTSIPDGYGGFDWNSNAYVINGGSVHRNSGYDKGTVSGNYTAFNWFARPFEVSREGLFNFEGAYLTAAWNTGLNIVVEGFESGALKYSETVTVDTDAPTWFDFDFLSIDSLNFSTFGGVDANPHDSGGGTHFAMDNFTYNTEPVSTPEPASLLALLALGGCGVGSMLKRKN